MSTQGCEYEVSGARGEPHWDMIFGYLLQHFGHIRLFQTAFVLVDNRDLTAPETEQASLAHWPTVAAWWASRLSLHGPARELCDLIFVPIGPAAGHYWIKHSSMVTSMNLPQWLGLQPNVLFSGVATIKQTVGGLRNTTEAKQFRRKLLSRCLGLRCDTEYTQPHFMSEVVASFATGPAGSMVNQWSVYLRGEAAVETLSKQVVQYLEAIPDELVPVY